MKIAVVGTYPPSMGTLNEYMYHLLDHLRMVNGIDEIHLVAEKLDNDQTYEIEEKESSCEVIPHECWTFNSMQNPYRIVQLVKRIKPDIVLFNIQFLSFGDSKVAAALGLMTPMLLKRIGIPSVVLLHNILEEVDLKKAEISSNPILNKIYNGIGKVLTRMLLQSDLLTVTIPKYVETLQKHYNTDKVALIPHGSFEVPEIPEQNLPDGPLQVMTFGKFGTYKKVEIMIEAVEIIRSRTDLYLEIVIAGSDNPNVVGYLDGVKEKYKHVDNLRFTGYVAEEEVPGLFRDSAVVVFPYTSTTGSSGVLHQAGSYGCAVALPDLGDLSELMKEEGYEAGIFDYDSPESLADVLQEILENESYRKNMGMKNYYAATSLPMSDIAHWYYLHFKHVVYGSSPSLVSKETTPLALPSESSMP